MTSDLLTKTKNMLDTDSQTATYRGSSSSATAAVAATMIYATTLLGMTGCDVDRNPQTSPQRQNYAVEGSQYERLKAEKDSLCYKLAKEQGAELNAVGSGHYGSHRWKAWFENGSCEFPYDFHDPGTAMDNQEE